MDGLVTDGSKMYATITTQNIDTANCTCFDLSLFSNALYTQLIFIIIIINPIIPILFPPLFCSTTTFFACCYSIAIAIFSFFKSVSISINSLSESLNLELTSFSLIVQFFMVYSIVPPLFWPSFTNIQTFVIFPHSI